MQKCSRCILQAKQIQVRWLHTLPKKSSLVSDLSKSMGIRNLEDWYNITTSQVKNHENGIKLLSQYNGSLVSALRSNFPDYPWKEHKFQRVSQNYWDNKDNQRKFMDDIAKELGLTKMEDWYHVTTRQVASRGGTRLLQKFYEGSLINAVKSIYPDFPWIDHKFDQVPRNYWDIIDNQRKFMDDIAKELGVNTMEDWYHISVKLVVEKGGGGLLSHYGRSLFKALSSIYPEYPWKRYLFGNISVEYWKKPENQIQFINALGKELGVRTVEDWLKVNSKQVIQHGGSGLLRHYNGSLMKLLNSLFPDSQLFSWSSQEKMTSIGHRNLMIFLARRVFPDMEYCINFKLEYTSHDEKLKKTELDIWYPQLKLAFEYQGIQHFQSTFRGKHYQQQLRDQEKKRICKEHGITLIPIPYWWDQNLSSLLATIHQYRPDLIPADRIVPGSSSITTELPVVESLHRRAKQDPSSVFIKMAAYSPYIDPVDKILTQHYEGERAIWNPKKKVFVVLGRAAPIPVKKQITPPPWFGEQLPDIYLDGELWSGKPEKMFESTDQLPEQQWGNVKFMIFNSPDPSLNHKPYIERHDAIQNIIGSKPNAKASPYIVCRAKYELEEYLVQVLVKGGKGVLMHDPTAPYVPSMMPLMWKVQQQFFDVAVVIRADNDQALCKTTIGIEFLLLTTQPLQPNDIIVYTYFGLTGGNKPLYPQLLKKQ